MKHWTGEQALTESDVPKAVRAAAACLVAEFESIEVGGWPRLATIGVNDVEQDDEY